MPLLTLDRIALAYGHLPLLEGADLPWPPFPEQADRFLAKLVGLAPPAG